MAKFNEKSTLKKQLAQRPDATINYEGGIAFEMEAKTKLMTEALSTFMETRFYDDQSNISKDRFGTPVKDPLVHFGDLRRSVSTVLDIDPLFVLKLAAFARTEMHLRSVPVFLINEFANSGKAVEGSRKYVTACMQRPDDITELLSLSLNYRKQAEHLFGEKRKSMLVLRGIAPAFNKFDEYQLAKYNREGSVRLRDALMLSHPVPKNKEQQNLFDKLVQGTLDTPDTWEVRLSGEGASKESWESIIPKMGYMATLKNLRNFLKYGVSLDIVVKRLTDPVAVSKSRMYPFRYYQAYRAIRLSNEGTEEDKNKLCSALEQAMALSVSNIPKIPGKSLVIVDASYSMVMNTISERSVVTAADVAGLFGAITSDICEESDIIVFADTYGAVEFNPGMSILKKMDRIKRSEVGQGTYAYLPMEFARTRKLKYDRIFLFSDMQCYNRDFSSGGDSFANQFLLYQREVNPKVFLYSINLLGYGTSQVPEDTKNTLILSGFSEKILELINPFETGKDSLVKRIEEYKV